MKRAPLARNHAKIIALRAILIVWFVVLYSSARAAEIDTGQRVLIHYPDGRSGISGLTFESYYFPLYFEPGPPQAIHSKGNAKSPLKSSLKDDADKENSSPFRVLLVGRWQRKHASLLVGTTTLSPRAGDGYFSVRVPIREEMSLLTFRSVDAKGVTQEQRIELKMAGFQTFRSQWKGVPPARRPSVQAGIGYSLNTLILPLGSEYHQSALTLKAATNFVLVPGRWDLGGSVFFTAMPLGISGPTETTIRYLGINIRAGYQIPFVSSSWRAFLHGGYYFNTMLTSPTEIGYRSIGGPQVFPVLVKAFPRGDLLTAYFKYSPISAGFAKFVSLQSRELAFGGAYRFAKKPISVTVDYANLNLETDQGLSFNRSFTAGMSIVF